MSNMDTEHEFYFFLVQLSMLTVNLIFEDCAQNC